jgi:hypothetical protein
LVKRGEKKPPAEGRGERELKVGRLGKFLVSGFRLKRRGYGIQDFIPAFIRVNPCSSVV